MPQNNIDEKNEIDDFQSPSYSINRSQKLAVAVLAFFTFFTIVMWSIQFKKNLSFSVQPSSNQNIDVKQALNIDPAEQSENDLRAKDTDGDGLNDWEELNTYKTSPYLPDSDSDGFSDKIEIESDNDPNCPVGRDCYTSTPAPSANIENDLLEISDNPPDEQVQAGPKTEEIKNLEDLMYGDGDVAELRQMLIDNGMEKADLDKVSDEELLSLFRETIEGN